MIVKSQDDTLVASVGSECVFRIEDVPESISYQIALDTPFNRSHYFLGEYRDLNIARNIINELMKAYCNDETYWMPEDREDF